MLQTDTLNIVFIPPAANSPGWKCSRPARSPGRAHELLCKECIQPSNLTGDVPLPAPPPKGGKPFHFCSFDLLCQTLLDACGNGCLLKRINAVRWTLKSLFIKGEQTFAVCVAPAPSEDSGTQLRACIKPRYPSLAKGESQQQYDKRIARG